MAARTPRRDREPPTSVRLPANLRAWVEARAKEKKITRHALIIEALIKYREQNEKETAA